MITGTIRTNVDHIWTAFWSGGISNPMEVIEQLTYLLFINRLDGASDADQICEVLEAFQLLVA